MPDIGPVTRQYFANTVRPALERAVRDDDGRLDDLAYKLGRFIGRSSQTKLLTSGEEPLEVSHTSVVANGETIAIGMDETDATVIDYGMGLLGLNRHLAAVKAGDYTLVGVQKGRLETVTLQGVVDYNRCRQGQVILMHGGITAANQQLFNDEWDAEVDVVIASRVHEAGKDLVTGLAQIPRLLRDETGMLIARGPRQYDTKGIGYDRVRTIIERLPRMDTLIDKPYLRSVTSTSNEPNRLIVARKT